VHLVKILNQRRLAASFDPTAGQAWEETLALIPAGSSRSSWWAKIWAPDFLGPGLALTDG